MKRKRRGYVDLVGAPALRPPPRRNVPTPTTVRAFVARAIARSEREGRGDDLLTQKAKAWLGGWPLR